MRSGWWLVTAAVLLAAILAAAIAWSYFQPPWVQVLGDAVLRSNAPPKVLADAESAVLDKHKNIIVGPDGKRSDPSASGRGQYWTTGPSPEHVTARVARQRSQLTDKEGHRLSFERIESSGAPTVVIIEFDEPAGTRSIVTEMVTELQKQGVTIR